MKLTACVWCSNIIRVSDDYNDLQHKGVCSEQCAINESYFCQQFSDEEIGIENYTKFGVNPNHRGRNAKKK